MGLQVAVAPLQDLGLPVVAVAIWVVQARRQRLLVSENFQRKNSAMRLATMQRRLSKHSTRRMVKGNGLRRSATIRKAL